MKILITGICGFAGSTLAKTLKELDSTIEIIGIDNLSRSGSYLNRSGLNSLSITVHHGDVRSHSDLESLPSVDWIIDAAALASVLAGVDGTSSTRQLIEHNLYGTVNLLEYAKRCKAGLILLSTSRVYSIADLSAVPVETIDESFQVKGGAELPDSVSEKGITETFSTSSPISLYGATKLSSEVLALEYGHACKLPIWINRCGVLAGAGQFGYPEQGIFTYWINSYLRERPLKYIGFNGTGYQVRDCLHPRDVAPLLLKQVQAVDWNGPRIFNVAGGRENSISLKKLSAWCHERYGARSIASDAQTRMFDVPWLVMDSSLVAANFGWKPETRLFDIFEEIALHAEANPDWLSISGNK